MKKSSIRLNVIKSVSFFSLILCFSCVQNLYKAYYRGDGNTMYFIYPMDFKTKQFKADALVDITFEDQKKTLTLNTTIISNEIKEITAISLVSGNTDYKLNEVTRLFREVRKRDTKIRYTGVFDKSLFFNIEKKDSLYLLINDKFYFYPTKKSLKKLIEVDETLNFDS